MVSRVFSHKRFTAVLASDLDFGALLLEVLCHLLLGHLFLRPSGVGLTLQRTLIDLVPRALVVKVMDQILILVRLPLAFRRSNLR